MPSHGFGQGHFYPYLPEEVKRLPIGLLRSHQYPGNPRGFREALEQYLGGQLPVAYYPQRMAFQKWKTPPVPAGYGQSALSAYAAGWQPRPWNPNQMIGGHTYGPPTHYPARVPVVGWVDRPQQMGLRRMPMPTDNMSPNLRRGYVPLSRGVPPANGMVTADVINRFAATRVAHQAAPHPQTVSSGADVTTQALESVRALQHHFESVIGGETRGPWFMRMPG